MNTVLNVALSLRYCYHTVYSSISVMLLTYSVCQFRYWEISRIRVSVRLLIGTAFHFSLSVPLLIPT